MASINRTGERWVVRYREPGGRTAAQRERTFNRKADAQAFAAKVEHDKLTGVYVDPMRGRLKFGEYAREWMDAQPHKPATADTYWRDLRNHLFPVFEGRPLAAIRKTEIQGWVKGLSATLAPATVKRVYGIFASVMRAAVQDDRLGKTPCVNITLPDVPKTIVRVLEPAEVHALADAMNPRYSALVYLGAGAGLRQGEAFGMCASRVRWLERRLTVDQQVSLVTGKEKPGPTLASPKTKSSVRDVPLPSFVLDALSAHITENKPTGDVLFTTERGNLIRRSAFNEGIWRPATETVDTYGHLLPDSEDRSRSVLDAIFGSRADLVLTSESKN